MTFGLRALALSAAVLGQKCPTGKALCDCISSSRRRGARGLVKTFELLGCFCIVLL